MKQFVKDRILAACERGEYQNKSKKYLRQDDSSFCVVGAVINEFMKIYPNVFEWNKSSRKEGTFEVIHMTLPHKNLDEIYEWAGIENQILPMILQNNDTDLSIKEIIEQVIVTD